MDVTTKLNIEEVGFSEPKKKEDRWSSLVLNTKNNTVFGKIIGGKKLSKISPNKTIAGTVGSFILSVIPLIIVLNFNYLDIEFNPTNIMFCLLISLISQLGDLFISLIKRKAKIKDTGNLLPGHGGILDRVDGIIFAVPFSYFLLKLF